MPIGPVDFMMTPEEIDAAARRVAGAAANAGRVVGPVINDLQQGVGGMHDWALDRMTPAERPPAPRNLMGGIGGATLAAEPAAPQPVIMDAIGNRVNGSPPPAATTPATPHSVVSSIMAQVPFATQASVPAATTAPAAAAGAPSWDALRQALGQGTRPAVPQIFNRDVEQNPLATPYDTPRRESQAWDLYNASTLGTPAEVLARRQEIIGRHNTNRALENEYYNMGRGMYSIPRSEAVGQFGLDPAQGGGAAGRNAGAHETSADAQRTEALTRAATAEFGMSSAAARQRFMERFPHATPAQLEQLVAGEEARGGFSPTTLRFLGGAPRPSAVFPVQAAPAGAPATTPQSSLLQTGGGAAPATAPPVYADIQRQLEAIPGLARPTAGANGAIPADVSPRRLIMQAQNARPDIFSAPEQRRALTAYLNSRYTPTVLHGSGGAGRAWMEDLPVTNPLRIFRNAAQQEAEAPARSLIQSLLEAQR